MSALIYAKNINLTFCRARLATIFGANSEYPCPMCLIPKREMYALGGIWPARTIRSVDELMSRASGSTTKKQRRHILKEQSMRDIEVRFSLVDSLSVLNLKLCRTRF